MSDWAGGLGDSLDISEIIQQKENLLQIMASQSNLNPSDWEDAVQEGRIRLWQALLNGRGRTPAYAHTAARNGIRNLTRRRPHTGAPPHRGRKQVEASQSLDHLHNDFGIAVLAAELLENVEIAYHHGEIYSAISDLPEQHKRYVMLRFWGGLTNAEIASELGRRPGNVARTWETVIRPVLQEKLKHLANCI